MRLFRLLCVMVAVPPRGRKVLVRAGCLFAGISLQGATLRDDGDENKALYGSVPADAQAFMATVGKY